MSNEDNRGSPTSFGFLLLNKFTLISLSSAIEPLRMANRICRQELYNWKTISESSEAVTASDGLKINVDCGIESNNALDGLDVVIVCSGIHVEKNSSVPILKWLNKVKQRGLALGSICTGSYVLASAGLLNGYQCSIHWENMASLRDLFPNVNVNRKVFTIDRNRYTSSGGSTPGDMMLHFITESCGAEVSAGVAEQFIYERIRHPADEQKVPLRHIVGIHSRKLMVAVELMETNISEPLSQEDLASYVGISRRQLQRLFRRYLLNMPSRYYLQLRLQRARHMLHQTNWSLVEISTQTGFVSTSHFSKSYKSYFGHPPSMER